MPIEKLSTVIAKQYTSSVKLLMKKISDTKERRKKTSEMKGKK